MEENEEEASNSFEYVIDRTGNEDEKMAEFDDIEEEDEFEDFASMNWEEDEYLTDFSCEWDTGWDDENLDDPFTKQLYAELAESSKKEKAANENSKG